MICVFAVHQNNCKISVQDCGNSSISMKLHISPTILSTSILLLLSISNVLFPFKPLNRKFSPDRCYLKLITFILFPSHQQASKCSALLRRNHKVAKVNRGI